MLDVDTVEKRFGGLCAVDKVSLSVAEREILALIGPNGAGKTTLFNLIAGALAPDAGSIRFQGEALPAGDAAGTCHRGLARTFQIPQLFGSMSVLDTVMVGALRRHADIGRARELAREVVQRVGLGGREDQPSATLTISGKKRLEVARALATGPRMILLDEVMAGLVMAEVAGILELIRTLRDGGMTVLLVEHNIEAVLSVADRVVVLDQGRKIADGAPRAVLDHPDVVRAYLGDDCVIA